MYQNTFQNFGAFPMHNMQRQSENNLIRVTGIEGAKAYQMPPNSTVALFDGGEDIMYIQATDGAGFPTIRVFRFEPIDVPGNTPQQVSREEFETLRKELENVKQLIQQSAKHSESVKTDNE